jgi:patatin-like phospholipase/acyl hydrolase
MKKVLILSGGGAKGSLQIEILKNLENRNLLNDIDLIIGSSVGAINGSMLAYGYDASYIKNLYPDMIKKIFKKRFFKIPIYDRNNFIKIWDNLIGSHFLMRNVKIPIIISTTDFLSKKTHYFKSYDDLNEPLLHPVLKSFAAPYYFGTISDDKTRRVYSDGGAGYDNYPITEAILETLKYIKEEIHFIIVGSGFENNKENYDKIKNRGVLWQLKTYMFPLDGGFARVSSRENQIGQLEFICKQFNNIHFDYYDIEIPKKYNKMDKIKYIDKYFEFGDIASQKPLISF